MLGRRRKPSISPRLSLPTGNWTKGAILKFFIYLVGGVLDTRALRINALPGLLIIGRWVGLFLAGLQSSVWAQPQREILSITVNLLELPSSRAAQSALQSPTRIFWDQTPLRTGLQELSQQFSISIWLDRDIDPNHLINSTPADVRQNASLLRTLEHIASVADAELGLIENVIYMGPHGRVSRLQRAAVELHDKLSRAGGTHQPASLRELQWDELATPTEMLQQIESHWKIEIAGELPHDLFHAGRFLQPSTLATQATVLLGGFDREMEWMQGNRFRIVPLQPVAEWQANYSKAELDLRGLASLRAKYVGALCQTRGSISHVQGPTAFHLALLAPPQANRPAVALGNKSERYEFEVANTPVVSVLEHLGTSLGFALQWDENCPAAMRERRISFKVKQVTLDQLLAEIARTSELNINRQGTNVKVSGPPR